MKLFLRACFFLPLVCHAALTINQYYDSNAVLQRGVEQPVSGTAVPGATVKVGFAGATATATADTNGHWRVTLPAQAAGGPYEMTVSDGTRTLTATNMMVGEVWLVSGQSNAFYPIERFAAKDDWCKDADYPKIRFIMATQTHLAWQLKPDAWRVATPRTVGKCSAMGFFFAKELQPSVDVPVGVVVAAADGSVIASWQTDGSNYKGFIENALEPLVPFPVKGVLWYQGESDGMFAKGYNYRFQLQKLIRDWRARWNAPEMPFFVAQLPYFKAYDLWHEVRDSQNWVAAQERGVYVVPTLDIGDLNNIHPPRKPELGRRLSLFTRKYARDGCRPAEGTCLKCRCVRFRKIGRLHLLGLHGVLHADRLSGRGAPRRRLAGGIQLLGHGRFVKRQRTPLRR